MCVQCTRRTPIEISVKMRAQVGTIYRRSGHSHGAHPVRHTLCAMQGVCRTGITLLTTRTGIELVTSQFSVQYPNECHSL